MIENNKEIFPGREIEDVDPNMIKCPFCESVFYEDIEICEGCGANINGSFNKWFRENKRVFYP